MNTLFLSKEDFLDFVSQYEAAVRDSKYTFMYKDNEVLTAYAKYIVEFYFNMS